MAATAAPPRPAHNDLLGRTRHIAAVLTSHGLGWLVDQAELAGRLPHWRRRRAPDDGPRPTGVHLRRAFEDLGATFIKLGQVLSTRGDLLPADVIDELSKLQDAVPAAPFAELRPVLERELGEAGLARFTWIDEHPLGSASVGQVHAARLDSGDEVVIKIQRPGVARLVEQDLQILRRLVRWLSANTAFGQDYDLTATTSPRWPTSSPSRCAPSSTSGARRRPPTSSGATSTTSRCCGCRASIGR
ncbi:MAG: AarF/UbiB family protein [Solirubrobacteraceae bacterium]|nr:AarF/UbiB family protein [Solirubrobacteraceae bacterium]